MIQLFVFTLICDCLRGITYLPIMAYRWLRSTTGYILKRRNHPVWIHCSGLGEVIALENLIAQLATQRTDRPILITCATKNGTQEAQRRYTDHTVIAPPAHWSLSVALFIWHHHIKSVCIFDIQLVPRISPWPSYTGAHWSTLTLF